MLEIIRKKYPAFIIVAVFLTVVVVYRSGKIEEMQNKLSEHARVIVEPLWSFDTQQLKEYLDVIAQKYNYKEIVVVSDNGDVLHQKEYELQGDLSLYLASIGLLPQTNFEQDVYYDDRLIGKIIVTWWDTSIYFYTNAFIVTLLLILIAHLYSKVLQAKKSLEEKILVIKDQMTELRQQKEYIEEVFNVIPEGLITVDKDLKSLGSNHSFEMIVSSWASAIDKDPAEIKTQFLNSLRKQLLRNENGQYFMNLEGYTVHIEYNSSIVPSFQKIDRVVSIRDITKLTSMERQLAQSQKLEAVGRLAAGIAHEINTPTQYVLSNVDFLMESHNDVAGIIDKVETLARDDSKAVDHSLFNEISEQIEEADWVFLKEEIPVSIEQSREGLRRISSIVSAMKHFSHPSGETPELNDINGAIENTVSVARNEWKYVANVDLELSSDLPKIPCFLDELNQVFLGMIVNSSHAIEDKYGEGSGKKGTITITTEDLGEDIVITVKDNGAGMPNNVAERVFDPFFTTKQVNKGTGQGLAIAHDVIVNRHHGSIAVNSEQDEGTVFTITLPRSPGGAVDIEAN